jgi:hypothetical protein
MAEEPELHFALMDWNRSWYLVPLHQAKECPGIRIDDPVKAGLRLSWLCSDPANLVLLGRCLAADLGSWRPVPTGPRLLAAMRRRLESRRLVLVQGPVRVSRSSAPRKDETQWEPVDRKDWQSGDGEGPAVREAEAGIEFACGHELEPVPTLEVEYEVEAPLGLHSEYEIGVD